VHYAARRRSGEPISTAFVESAVNEITAKRMNKKQQMRWNRTTVQSFLDVRTAVQLEGTPSAIAIRASGPRTMIRFYRRPPDPPRSCMLSECSTTTDAAAHKRLRE
jgi:hypothetical protein